MTDLSAEELAELVRILRMMIAAGWRPTMHTARPVATHLEARDHPAWHAFTLLEHLR
jgi:hypothetical protein